MHAKVRLSHYHLIGLTVLLAFYQSALAQSPLELTAVPKNAPQGFSHIFAKHVDVFGVKVYATADTPDAKVMHAANVLAQYLDNDADGKPDNLLVIKAMLKAKAGMMMVATQRAMEELDVHKHIPEKIWNNMTMQGLWGEETLPGAAKRGRFDATLEEVLHLVTQVGFAHAYSKVFGEKSGSQIADAMDKARGGHFRKVPKKYPKGAWYTYDDRSCDYGCQITEYTYWGLTSILGAQDYPGRLDDIKQEWRPNTKEKLKHMDPALYKLLTDPQYKWPTVLPNGKYRPKAKKPKKRP
jgi:hypothetical protein